VFRYDTSVPEQCTADDFELQFRGPAACPEGSRLGEPPTCFPSIPPGQCLDDHIIQLKTSTFLPPYTKTADGRVRSYATTPPKCPAKGHWRTTVQFSWADGSVDDVVTKQRCKRPRKRRRT
jgi:hypothetical protein